MDFDSFLEGPLFKIVFLIFCVGIIVRIAFFISSIFKHNRNIEEKGGHIFTVFARSLVPFHRAVPKKPLYSSFRYIFHICLFVVPIWLAGHISLWEDSGLEWSWVGLPDGWADAMTIIAIALALFFLLRRILFKDERNNSSVSDYVIIVLAGLPFASGYFLAHGNLDNVAFFGDNMWAIHVLSGEAMILMTAFLFCRTRLNALRCTGCASCELACPTGTIESKDRGHTRFFNYSHYQCICCASCVNTCPEDAAELRHEVSLKNVFQIFAKNEIRAVEMQSCNRCGALFVPEPLMEKIEKTFTYEYLNYCSTCRKTNMGDYLQQLSPWHRKRKIAHEKGLGTG